MRCLLRLRPVQLRELRALLALALLLQVLLQVLPARLLAWPFVSTAGV